MKEISIYGKRTDDVGSSHEAFLSTSYGLLRVVTEPTARLRAVVPVDSRNNPYQRLLLRSLLTEVCLSTLATPRRGRRRLLSWPFNDFVRLFKHATVHTLSVRRTVPTSLSPDDPFTR